MTPLSIAKMPVVDFYSTQSKLGEREISRLVD